MSAGFGKMAALAFGLALLAMPSPARAAGCEGVRDAFAYNECLSRTAPQRAQRVTRGGRAEDPEASVPARRRAREAARAGRGVAISGRGGRRVRAVIDPWQGVRSAPRGRRR